MPELLLKIAIVGERDVIQLDTKEKAIKYASKKAKQNNKWYNIKRNWEGWIVTNFIDDEWQGWHYSQIFDRTKFDIWEELVVTPTDVLTADKVPFVFEYGNNFYYGDSCIQKQLDALPVACDRIFNNKVFVYGRNFIRKEYIGDPDYDEKEIVGNNQFDWQLMDIKFWNNHE
jgi:hypothetical protein